MTHTRRRIAPRTSLGRPVEARLLLCGGAVVDGWILDEQADGLGMVFGAHDVEQLEAHGACCVGGPIDLEISVPQVESPPIPVRLAHVTRQPGDHVCRAGLTFDVTRLRAGGVSELLSMWERITPPIP